MRESEPVKLINASPLASLISAWTAAKSAKPWGCQIQEVLIDVEIRDPVASVTNAMNKSIATLLARHPVIAQPASDCVRTAIPENAIIARSAIDHIIANKANQ